MLAAGHSSFSFTDILPHVLPGVAFVNMYYTYISRAGHPYQYTEILGLH